MIDTNASATKADLALVETNLRTEIQRAHTETLKALVDHQRWVFGAILGQYAQIIGLYGLIISRLH